MFRLALAGAIALVLSSAAFAQDCSTYDDVLANEKAIGIDAYVIPADKLPKVVKDVEAITGDDYGDVTRGFMLMVPGEMIVGFEAKGCLFAPIYLAAPPETGA